MINSRDPKELHPKLNSLWNELFIRCIANDIRIILTSTYRDYEAQAALYAQGRMKPGKIVTNAKPGYSMHNFRLAFDVVPTRAGVPIWDTSGPNAAMWATIGRLGQEVGLEWGGAWESFKDLPHFQYTEGLTLAELRAGKRIKGTL